MDAVESSPEFCVLGQGLNDEKCEFLTEEQLWREVGIVSLHLNCNLDLNSKELTIALE